MPTSTFAKQFVVKPDSCRRFRPQKQVDRQHCRISTETNSDVKNRLPAAEKIIRQKLPPTRYPEHTPP